MLPNNAAYFARLTSGTEHAMIIKLPAKIPAEPTPEMARPMMRVVELGDVAQMSDPSSNMVIEHRYAHLILKRVKQRPQSSWHEHVVRKYAEPYQPTWSSE